MYLPESIADKNIEEMDMDEFLRLVAMADYAVDTLGYKKIAVLYNVADEYSTGGLCIEFADGASERGGE